MSFRWQTGEQDQQIALSNWMQWLAEHHPKLVHRYTKIYSGRIVSSVNESSGDERLKTANRVKRLKNEFVAEKYD